MKQQEVYNMLRSKHTLFYLQKQQQQIESEFWLIRYNIHFSFPLYLNKISPSVVGDDLWVSLSPNMKHVVSPCCFLFVLLAISWAFLFSFQVHFLSN